MRSSFLPGLSLLAALSVTPALADGHTPSMARADLVAADGASVGSVSAEQTASGIVLITVTAEGLSPGWHAVHVHETGACDAEGGHKAAGGHLAGDAKHGVKVEGGPHPGDLPNQMVFEGGRMTAELFAHPALTMAGIMDEDGSAFIIHEGRDDYMSQPAGDAGSRVACGVFSKPE